MWLSNKLVLKTLQIVLLLVTITVLALPEISLADCHGDDAIYEPMVDLPYIDEGDLCQREIGFYINAFYRLAIAGAAFLAVMMIIFGGVKYMLSDVVTQKGEAKKDIRGALLGLIIVLGAVIILNTINTDLTDYDIFKKAIDTNANYTGTFDLFCVQNPKAAECSNTQATTGNISSECGENKSFIKCPNETTGQCRTNGYSCSSGEVTNTVDDSAFIPTANICSLTDTNCQKRCERVENGYQIGQLVMRSDLSGNYYECVFNNYDE